MGERCFCIALPGYAGLPVSSGSMASVWDLEWCTVVVDTHAMVERFFLELLLSVVEDCFREWCGGEGNAVDGLWYWRLEIFLVAQECRDRAWLGSPAVGFEG